MKKQDEQVAMAINCGLNVLSSEDIKVPTKDIEALVTLKGLFRALLVGELVLATPEMLKPATPEKVPEPAKGDEGSDNPD